MPYEPHIQIVYRFAEPGELPSGRVVWIKESAKGQAAVIYEPGEVWGGLLDQATLQCASQMVHGEWRPELAEDGRMKRPALGKLLGVSRWEAVSPVELPPGHLIHPSSRKGGDVWMVSWDSHTDRARYEVNDLLLRLAGDELWKQYWPGNRPVVPGQRLAPSITPLIRA